MYQTIVFLPLLAAIIAGLFGNRVGVRGAQVVTCGALIVSTVLSWVTFFKLRWRLVIMQHMFKY